MVFQLPLLPEVSGVFQIVKQKASLLGVLLLNKKTKPKEKKDKNPSAFFGTPVFRFFETDVMSGALAATL